MASKAPRTSHRASWRLLALAVGVASASSLAAVGYVPQQTLRVVGERGTPVPGAYAACFYSGRRFNLVDSISYTRSGPLLRSDAQGFLSLPRRLEERRRQSVELPRDLALELAAHLRTEVEAFARLHATTPRQRPPLTLGVAGRPAVEQQAILSRMRADLAREPLWGPYLVRRWAPRVAELERRLAGLD